MYEVELKLRASHDAVRERLDALGAERTGTVSQVDTYYDAPHRDFADAVEIEVREGAGDALGDPVTEGVGVADSFPREEIETGVEDHDRFDDILAALGFSPAAEVTKDRERYALDDYVVTLDTVAGLGEFVEIERDAPEDAVESTRQGAVSHLRSLGLDPDDQIRTSYLGLLLDSS